MRSAGKTGRSGLSTTAGDAKTSWAAATTTCGNA